MTILLVVTRSGRSLRLNFVSDDVRFENGDIVDLGGDAARAFEPSPLEPSPREELVWQLERRKATTEGDIVVRLGERIARYLLESQKSKQVFRIPEAGFTLRSLDKILSGHGLKTRGYSRRRFSERARFVFAAAASAGLHGLLLVRYARQGERPELSGGPLLAVHGEWSTRTRHVLTALVPTQSVTGIMVLGRPRQALGAIETLWKNELKCELPPLFRPLSPGAALKSIGRALRSLRKGFLDLDRPGPTHSIAAMSRQCYRHWLGAASYAWWSSSGISDIDVIFGHTGLADTSLLEFAQQDTGCRTIHVVHGLSSGLNFAGVSTLGLFRCGHDAQEYLRIGAYAASRAQTIPMPNPVRGGGGIALFSNYLHLINDGNNEEKLSLELQALSLVQQSAAESNLSSSEPLVWKPHPTLEKVHPRFRERLYLAARKLGWEELETADLQLLPTQVRLVVCSPSTVIVDLLQHGCLPVMLELGAPVEQGALVSYPVRANNLESLCTWYEMLQDESQQRRWFRECWEWVLPAATFGRDSLSSEAWL